MKKKFLTIPVLPIVNGQPLTDVLRDLRSELKMVLDGSAVEIAVKQYVLVPERISYIDRAKEVIYEALNAAGITIPFPQSTCIL
ncbi:MAG: hypothetical protein IJS62_08750 [Bacteroidales bacterium]|nr:hypothetical protein [Bacteroidales bacterium]